MQKIKKIVHTKNCEVKYLKNFKNQMQKRLNYLKVVVLLLNFLLCFFLVVTIYIDKDKYSETLKILADTKVEGESAPRGRIYDRNYNLLVDNESLPTILYKKTGKITAKEESELAYHYSKYLQLPYEKITTRNLKEFYVVIKGEEVEQKITEEEREKVKRRILTIDDIYNLKLSRITEAELNQLTEEDRKAAYLYFLMNHGYSYQEKIIKENASDEEYSYFSEHEEEMSGFTTSMRWKRKYLYGDTFKLLLGSVGPITKEEKNEYLKNGYALTDIVGHSYIEKQYEEILKGKKAIYKKSSSTSLSKLSDEKRGDDIVLTIDIHLQQKVEEVLKAELLRAKGEANTNLFNRSYVIIQEPETGEVLAMSGMQIIKTGEDYTFLDVSSGILTDPMTPGSVVKGGSMLVGYNTGAVEFGETKLDECIKIKSSPPKCSSHQIGYTDDIRALAESSNVYQFKIAIEVGGGVYRYDQPLKLNDEAFDIYRKTFAELGLGVKTEIDLPIESLGYIGKKKETNLLLNLSIGQYDTYTPIQLSQYITTLASNGKRLKPHLLKEIRQSTTKIEIGQLKEKIEPVILNTVTTKPEYLERIKEGFQAVVSYGTGRGIMGNAPNPAGKTGTSESFIDTNGDGVIDKESVSNAFVGYAPAENPKMTITVTSPDVEDPTTNISFHSYVNRRIAKELSNYYFTN